MFSMVFEILINANVSNHCAQINCLYFFAVAHYAANVTFMVTTRWVGKIANGHWPTHF